MFTKTSSVKDLEKVAKELLEEISKKDLDHATVVSLSGDLGAGKTTLTKEVARQLNIESKVKSPTFVLVSSYKISFDHFKNLIHIDAYRLEKEEELSRLGFGEWLEDKTNLIFVEWPERVTSLLPQDKIEVKIKHLSEEEREISW